MALCGRYRRERAHQTGASNRSKDWLPAEQTGPIDFDHDARSTAPELMRYKTDPQVPANIHTGEGNKDFDPKLPGYYVRMPLGDSQATQLLKKDVMSMQKAIELSRSGTLLPVTIRAPPAGGEEQAREPRVKGHKVASRWTADKWFEAPHYTQCPLQKDPGETWNSKESLHVQGDMKGQDRLMRAARRPEDVASPSSDGRERRHPVDGDSTEYYPGRDVIDAVEHGHADDYQVRPVHLPDFHNPPPDHGDSVSRMQRVREVIRQRYAGRPRLIRVFQNSALTKPGFVFPRDLQQVFDQMGIKVSKHECQMLVEAVDKDHKGAATFDEFADLIYGDRVVVGGRPHEPQERHVRHVTKSLVDSIVSHGPALGKAFCELDPERKYVISKEQFKNAIGTACSHASNQAIEFLWAAQFPGQGNHGKDNSCIDWRSFMSQLAHFAHDNRAPTPCTMQGRKRQYDLLQKTVPLTGGGLPEADVGTNRPAQTADDKVCIVAGKLVHRHADVPHKPREVAFLTPNYVEEIHRKAQRVEQTLPQRIPKARLRELCKNKEFVHQDELVQIISVELDQPKEQLYATSAPSRIGKADIEALVATQHHNRDHKVDVHTFINNVYKPPHEKKVLDSVNDGLNRHLRGKRPGRERPPHTEQPRYENYWQARHLMEQVNDAMAQKESSNGGRIKPARIFKRLDVDNDGYISLSDLKDACEHYQIPHASADLHAMFSELDRHDNGSVDIGEFTRHFEVFQGSLLDSMQKPIKSVSYAGGIQHVGPVQDKLDARDRAVDEGRMPGNMPKRTPRANSAPATPSSTRQRLKTGASVASSASHSVIYAPQVAHMASIGRISDVIRSRVNPWKPRTHESLTSSPQTRFGMTIHPDTRHVTEPTMPLSGSHMPDDQRFKTTNNVHSTFATPDHSDPQAEDAMRKHARNEFRLERIRQRQRDFAARSQAADASATKHDGLKVARKAMNQLNYERRVAMACA